MKISSHNIVGDNMVIYGKKIILIILFIFILISLTSCHKEDDLRLRIIANSDSSIDQSNKYKVKEAVQQILQDYHYLDVELLVNNLSKYLDSSLYGKLTIEFRDEMYPAKSYDGNIIPSGIYKSIVITIGEGKGKNFWTMLYPEYFNISFEDDNEVEYHSYIYDNIIK